MTDSSSLDLSAGKRPPRSRRKRLVFRLLVALGGMALLIALVLGSVWLVATRRATNELIAPEAKVRTRGKPLTKVPPPVITIEHASGFAWEGRDLDFVFHVVSDDIDITMIQVDIDRDGQFDLDVPYDAEFGGALAQAVPLLSKLGENVDNGDYPARLRVMTTNRRLYKEADFTITVGNVEPQIEIAELMPPVAFKPYTIRVSTSDFAPDTVTEIKILWGDGTESIISGSSGTATHTYRLGADYVVQVCAKDEDGEGNAVHFVSVAEPN